MYTAAEMTAGLHLSKAREYWESDRLELAMQAMHLALNLGLSPSHIYDLQRMIEAELTARREGVRVRCTEHLEVELPQSLEAVMRERLRERALRAWMDVTERLAVRWGKPVLITLFPSEDASLFVHARYGYYAERTERHKICLPLYILRGAFRLAVLHEATHAALHDAVGDHVPRWFDEGTAVWMEGLTGGDERRLRILRARGRLPTMDQVAARLGSYETSLGSDAAATAYAAAGSFIRSLVEAHGGAGVPPALWIRTLLEEMRRGERFNRAFRKATGESLQGAERRWRAELQGS